MINAIDLFSGIGGFSYAFHGFINTVLYCDISESCRKVLSLSIKKKYIDDAPISKDVRCVSIDDVPILPDMIFAGFPCQDLSACNHQGKGLDGSKTGLFFEIIRICDEIGSIQHVMMENVGKILKRGMMERLRECFEERGFVVSHVIVNASQCGAPHQRRRCFILATKDMDSLKHILLPVDDIWGTVPDNMISVVDDNHVRYIRERSGMCGNSIVPECIKSSFNFLVHGVPLPTIRKDFGVVLVDETNTPKYIKKRWGTPYASIHLYYPYKVLSPRSTTVLFNQVWYQDKNIRRRKKDWFIDPRFVEWMMGYPTDYTDYLKVT